MKNKISHAALRTIAQLVVVSTLVFVLAMELKIFSPAFSTYDSLNVGRFNCIHTLKDIEKVDSWHWITTDTTVLAALGEVETYCPICGAASTDTKSGIVSKFPEEFIMRSAPRYICSGDSTHLLFGGPNTRVANCSVCGKATTPAEPDILVDKSLEYVYSVRESAELTIYMSLGLGLVLLALTGLRSDFELG